MLADLLLVIVTWRALARGASRPHTLVRTRRTLSAVMFGNGSFSAFSVMLFRCQTDLSASVGLFYFM